MWNLERHKLRTSLSVVIPTFNRGEVLLETIDYLLSQSVLPNEIIIVDQTRYNDGDPVARKLAELSDRESIHWMLKDKPSIPMAMNSGAVIAKSEWLLYIDDDVRISKDFIESHLDTITESSKLAHVGQIVQPWQQPNSNETVQVSSSSFRADLVFRFNHSMPAEINNCMAGNLCVNRGALIEAGGFDENFYGVAYRFETEFCKRFCKVHDTLFYYSPKPILNHLYIKSGGTRAHANYLTSTSPVHSMGDYYLALLHAPPLEAIGYIVKRLFTSVVAKFYLSRPWYIPARMIAEIRGLASALKAYKKGQKLINATQLDVGKGQADQRSINAG